MSSTKQELIRVFIGSPHDVDPHHRRAIEIVKGINQAGWISDDIRVEPVSWRHNRHSKDVRLTPAQAFNNGTPAPADCDICVFIFHKRTGKTLAPDTFEENSAGAEPTGTQWEYYNALESDRKPLILVYRDKRNPDYDATVDGTPMDFAHQLTGLEDFFSTFTDSHGRHIGTVEQFAEDAKFEEQLQFELDRFVKSHIDNNAGANTETSDQKRSPLPPDYMAKLAQQTGNIELLGATDANEALPSSLPAIYVPAITTATPQYIDEDTQKLDERPVNQLVMERIGEQSLYLSGHPGSGKSTFCQWLTHCVARRIVPPMADASETQSDYRENLPPALADKIPVLIRLRDFTHAAQCQKGAADWRATDLVDALQRWLTTKPLHGLTGQHFTQLLANGDMLLILDGVDEVPEERQESGDTHYPRHALLCGLADALPEWQANGNRILISSRPYGLNITQKQQIALAEAELLPLDRALQNLFVHRWYQAADPGRATELATELTDELQERRELIELKSNPLLLTALCVKFKEGKRLPRDIHDLYNSITNQILYNRFRESERERERIRWRLEALALGMHAGPNFSVNAQMADSPMPAAPLSTLRDILARYVEQNPSSETAAADVQAKLNELLHESGLLLSRADDSAEFYHQDFRDFLAAECWSNRQRSFADAVNQHGTQRDWRRMLGFLFARESKTPHGREQALQALDTLAEQIPTLQNEQHINAALVMADCYSIAFGDECIEQIDSSWANSLRKVAATTLAKENRAEDRNDLYLKLGRLGWDTRPGVGLNDAGLPDIEWLPVSNYQHPLFISRYLITNRQYHAFIDAEDGYRVPHWWQGFETQHQANAAPSGYWSEPNSPREQISWFEAIAFTRWLTARGELPLQSGVISLPIEVEWLTAYVGDTTADFPWPGDTDPQRHANFDESGIRRTSAVGIFPAGNGISGASDMAGNVWEWMLNTRESKSASDIDTAKGSSRSLRGGAFGYNRHFLRAAFRGNLLPDNRNNFIGFRVVCRPH